jgi:hypothetical protein
LGLVKINNVYLSKQKLKHMTVKELIEELSKFNPETPVIGKCTDPTDYTFKVPIVSIDLDSPFDENGISGVDGEEMSDDIDYWDDETSEYIGEKVVIIDLGDV